MWIVDVELQSGAAERVRRPPRYVFDEKPDVKRVRLEETPITVDDARKDVLLITGDERRIEIAASHVLSVDVRPLSGRELERFFAERFV